MDEYPSHRESSLHCSREPTLAGGSGSADDLSAHGPDSPEHRQRQLRALLSMQEFLMLSHDSIQVQAEPSVCDTREWKQSGDTAVADDTPIAQLPGYEVLGELGRGGMGVIYKARQVSLKRLVALKMVLDGAHASREKRARFRTETEAVAKLQHPNIVQIHETGEHDGRLYFTMELVEGVSLAALLAQQSLAPAAAAELAATLADAVHYAHRQGIVHRDLKPANVLLQGQNVECRRKNAKSDDRACDMRHSSFGIPKLTDFGLAKHLQEDSGLTQSGAVLGTPCYMAPEQANGTTALIGPTTDVYALGAILYEMLTGKPPFQGASLMDTLMQVRHQEPTPPSRLQPKVPRDLEVICLKCLHKEPWQRYASAEALADDLRAFQAGRPIQARPVSPAERFGRWCRRNPVIAGLLLLVVCSILVGMIGVLHYAYVADQNARDARQAQREAEQAQRDAQTRAEQLRQSLVRQHVLTGDRCFDLGQYAQGLWWYARAWATDADQPQNRLAHGVRLGMALRNGPALTGVCFHDRPVLEAKFDPAGKTVLTRTDEPRVYLWDPFDSRQVTPPLEHAGEVLAAVFSPDSRRVATGAADGALRLWSARSGRLSHQIPLGSPVRALAYRPVDGLLAVATEDGAVRFVTEKEGKPPGPTLTLPAAVNHVAFSPNGRWLVTADAAGAARVWDVDSGKLLGDAMPHENQRGLDEHAVAHRCWPVFHPNLPLLATVHPSQSVTLWDWKNGKPRLQPIACGDRIRHLAFTPNGSHLIVNAGKTAQAFPLTPLARKSILEHPRDTHHGCVDPQGKVLATCSIGGKIHLWDWATGAETIEALQCASGVMSLEFCREGRHLLAAGHDGVVRVWRLQDIPLFHHHDLDCGRADRFLLGWVADYDHAVYSPDGVLRFRWKNSGQSDLHKRDVTGPSLALPHPLPVVAARYSPDGSMLVTQDQGSVMRWWSTATGQILQPPIPLQRRLALLEFSRDGRRLLTFEGQVDDPAAPPIASVWEISTGKRIFGPISRWDTGPLRYGDSRLLHHLSRAALCPDGDHVILASDSTGVLGLWEIAGGREVRRETGYHGRLFGICFTPDGSQFLTIASDTAARLWHTATLVPAGPPLRHATSCRSADVAPDGWRVATVDDKRLFRLWNGHTGELLGRFPLPAKYHTTLWFTLDGRRVVVNGGWNSFAVPVFPGTIAQLQQLLPLITGMQPEHADALRTVDPEVLRRDALHIRRIWRLWRDLVDD